MSNKSEVDVRAYKVGLGLAALVAGVVGFGWWRNSRAKQKGLCAPLEESVYRGFKYRIETCPVGEGHGYLSIIPAQEVGSVHVLADEGEMLVDLNSARTWAQRAIDQKLGPQLKATFMGVNL